MQNQFYQKNMSRNWVMTVKSSGQQLILQGTQILKFWSPRHTPLFKSKINFRQGKGEYWLIMVPIWNGHSVEGLSSIIAKLSCGRHRLSKLSFYSMWTLFITVTVKRFCRVTQSWDGLRGHFPSALLWGQNIQKG